MLITHIIASESIRNQLLILLAYDGALRREEVVSLRVDDFDWSARLITIRPDASKSDFERTVTYSRSTEDLLTRYLWNERANLLAAFGGDQKGPLFLSESNRNAGQAITLGTFNDVIECAASRGLVSPMQWARTRRKVLGSTSYLMLKGKGNNSMSVKRQTGENAVAKAGAARPV